MNEVIKTILERRSIRSFQDKPVSREDLELIVKAALHAPSGMGRQTWKFTVVTNKLMIKKLCDTVGKVLGRDNYNMYQPAAIIITTNLADSPWGKEDNACAMENIFLSAKSLGIGSVWINQLRDICQEEKVREILCEMEIPENHLVYGVAALGYADDTEIAPKERIGKVHFID